ncbi:TetR/AcrR family transcriptional regulator [Chitinilyticum piscinae]|uniref:TetR/AcrR family transcriptional regulator n=1 Tax=Chitinilyticum piscinae TaxID=2866724 RepID=A0A8J7FG44_9NEIS|nr:TetR/AcrR family transcriptional regulator [Chitinilyticum piscinae]MBE9608763.1 TetR/AcrR family transcriptional regulator [Chitinilyticum piscinae]
MRPINPERQAERRQHILAAALRCFAQKGFHKTRTADICAEAGMSPGNLFHYFASKEALIIALVEADQAEVCARFARATQAEQGWQALLALLDHHLGLCAEPVYVQLTLDVIGEAVRNPALMACVQRSEAERRECLARLFERHAQTGDFQLSSPPGQVADWFLLLLDGVLGRAMVEADFVPARYRADLLAALQLQVRPLTS